MVHDLSPRKWLYHITKACNPASLAPSHLLPVRSLSTCSHFRFLGRSESEKHPKIHISVFDRFFHRVTFRFSILGYQLRKRFRVFLSRFSHTLKWSVNEIEVPFTNSILVKNGTRRAILFLFTLVKGFELASQWYRFTTFSDRLD